MYKPQHPSTHWSYVVEAGIRDGAIEGIRVSIVEAVDGQITYPTSGNADEHESYLRRSSTVIGDENRYTPHWQAIAARLHDERYQRRLSNYGLCLPGALLHDPVGQLDTLTRRIAGIEVRDDRLAMKEYIQNPSHRSVIRTALGLATGAETDVRSPETTQAVETLFNHIRSESNESILQKQYWRCRLLYRRLLGSIGMS